MSDEDISSCGHRDLARVDRQLCNHKNELHRRMAMLQQSDISAVQKFPMKAMYDS
jgi:hypothetical protein